MKGRRIGRNVNNSAEMFARVARKLKLSGLTGRHKVFGMWETIVGRRYAEVSRPDRVHGDTLVVCAVDAMWGQDIKMHAPLILEKIAERTGDPGLKRLRVITGPVEIVARPPAPVPLDSVIVDTADIETALDATPLRDKPELRQLMASIWANGRRRALLNERKSL